MALYWDFGTPPLKIRSSVPKLKALYSVRTLTSWTLSLLKGVDLISPRPGSTIQNARAWVSFIWACPNGAAMVGLGTHGS